MARKYGAEAWEWMPNWGKVRNRISQRNYRRYHQRTLMLSAFIPAAIASAAVVFVSALIRTAS